MSLTEGNNSNVLRGAILVLLSGVSYAPVAVFGKICVAEGMEVATLNVIRLVLGVAILAGFALARYRSGARMPRASLVLSLGFGALVWAVGGSFFFISLGMIDASLAYLLMYTYPAIVVIISILLGFEKFEWLKAVAVVLTLLGVAMVLRVGGLGNGNLLVGIAFVMGTTLFYSCYVIVCDRYLMDHSEMLVTFYSVVGGATAMLATIPWQGFRAEIFVGRLDLMAMAGATALGSVLSLLLFLKGIKLIGASWAAIISTVQPVLVVFLSWAVLGEVLGPLQLVGMALLLFGVLLIRREKKPAVKTAT